MGINVVSMHSAFGISADGSGNWAGGRHKPGGCAPGGRESADESPGNTRFSRTPIRQEAADVFGRGDELGSRVWAAEAELKGMGADNLPEECCAYPLRNSFGPGVCESAQRLQ